MTQLALSSVDDRRLEEAAERFGRDVLGGWSQPGRYWRTETELKRWRAGKGRARPSDFRAHFRGEQTSGVGPIRRAIVVDHDLEQTPSGQEAPAEAKERSANAVSLLLDSFGIPHVHFDGARGVHTWIRLNREPTQPELDALAELLNGEGRHQELADAGAVFEVYPNGGRNLRLPFGRYLGRARHALPRLEDEAALAWLEMPERVTDAQLAAIVEAAEALLPANQPNTTRQPHHEPPSSETANESALGPLQEHQSESDDAQKPIEGWKRWPACKKTVATNGPAPQKRHDTLLALACEAVESGERDRERLVRFLRGIPRPSSRTSDDENERDVLAAVDGALRLFEANDARRLSGCPHIAYHSGNPSTRRLRGAIEHACTDEAAAACPILARWRRGQEVPAFAYIIRSSIWRDGSGQYGRGLGYKAKEVYKLLLSRSAGDPTASFEASHRYIEAHLLGVVRREGIRAILRKLIDHGLVERVSNDAPIYRVPHRPKAWIDALARELGTDEVERRQRDELERHWQSNKNFRPRE